MGALSHLLGTLRKWVSLGIWSVHLVIECVLLGLWWPLLGDLGHLVGALERWVSLVGDLGKLVLLVVRWVLLEIKWVP